MDLVNLKIEKIKAILTTQKKEKLLAEFNATNFAGCTDHKDVITIFKRMIPKEESAFKNDYEKLEENLEKWVQGYKNAYPAEEPEKFKLINQLLINTQDKVELTKEKSQMDVQILMMLMKARTQHPQLKEVIREWQTNVQTLEKTRTTNTESPIKIPGQLQKGIKDTGPLNKPTFKIEPEQRSIQKSKIQPQQQPPPQVNIPQPPPEKPKNIIKVSNKESVKEKQRQKQKQRLQKDRVQKERIDRENRERQESQQRLREEKQKEERKEKQKKDRLERQRLEQQEKEKDREREREKYKADLQEDYLSSNNSTRGNTNNNNNLAVRQKTLRKIDKRDQLKAIRTFLEKSDIKIDESQYGKIANLLKENMMNHMRNVVDRLVQLAHINNWNHKTSGDQFRYFSNDKEKKIKFSNPVIDKVPKIEYYRVQYPLKMKIYSELTMFQEREEQKLLNQDPRKDPLKNQKQKRNEKQREILDYVRGEGYRRTDNQDFKEQQSGLEKLKIKLVSVQYLLESDATYVNSALLLKTYFM